MNIAQYSPYAIARFDGVLMFDSIQAGVMTIGLTKSPIVRFRVLAGVQSHPIWSLDRLAITVYSYCDVAKDLHLAKTALQVSLTASWVSTEQFSNLVATHVEWHTAPGVRAAAQRILADMGNDGNHLWPLTEMSLPIQERAPAK
ncbi:MAG TPA: hypothetical protein VLX61_02220 [Anaerolineales bacterium]|nr:hypothetical protein [Anaerolineales bacterium]